MTTVLAVDHFVLVVSDVDRTLAWYQHYAGLAPMRVDEWRREEVFFPSLRVSEETIIDVLPGRDEGSSERGHLDHICFVVSVADRESLAADPSLEVVDSGVRYGARGDGESLYVRDPDGLLVEFRSY
ncbi:MAG TPA: VOC family protein [Acidimicrobiales bacterium]|nr:VOC family protein [Acidimicrobiales bacterium]